MSTETPKAPHDDIPQLPEHWVNVQSLKWLHQRLESFPAMANHISTSMYTGQLHKIRVDTEAMLCSIPAMMFNGSAITLQLSFEIDTQGGWNLTGVTLQDVKGLTILVASMPSSDE